ncbi:MAG: YqiA/YcfP family alpha/beta fold hydrolase [Myxococcota bacterium]
MRYAYIHGFGSSPRSTKGLALHEAFTARGLPFERPEMNRPSFAELTYTCALEALDELAAAHPGERFSFVGSSMGGYLSALWAERNPDRVGRLVLLCPAFRMMERWVQGFGDEALERWELDGYRLFPDGAGVHTPVHFGFIEDGRTFPPQPEPTCSTLVLHGTLDDVVPIELSRDWAAQRDHVDFIELVDDHRLHASMPAVLEHVFRFFGV